MSRTRPEDERGKRFWLREPGPKSFLGGSAHYLWLPAGIALGAIPIVVAAAVDGAAGLPDAALGASALLSIGLIMLSVILFRPASRDADDGRAPGQAAVPGEQPGGEGEEPVSLDPLTGLLTFQPFSQRLLDEFHLAKRYGGRGVVVLVDVNHLAEVNEQFGSEAGDRVLQMVANALQTTKRATDVIARLGDDEFGALLLGCDAVGAAVFTERLQEQLARESLEVQQGGRTTSIWVGISVGSAECGPDSADADEILTAAVDDLEESRAARDRRRERWAHSA